MKEEILNNLDNPKELETLYRSNKSSFKKEFNLIYQNVVENPTAQIWNERLNFENEEISWGTRSELAFVILASFIAGLIAKIPVFAELNPEYFYPRNVAYVVFPLLTAYFARRLKPQKKRLTIASLAILVSVVYINLLPDNNKSNTLILACVHMPLFLWTVLGFMFTANHLRSHQLRLDFLRYNGDLVVMTAIILIAGALLTGITFGLFTLIDLKIETFYAQYIVIWGLAAAPIIGTYLVQTNPQLVSKVSPVIARIFTPLVLVTLLVYLFAVISTGKDPYNDRDFLLIFNALLIGVMAIILFSIAGTSKSENSNMSMLLLFILSLVTVIVNGIALSAILFRISEWGITPNRFAVLGGNTLILINLLIVSCRLFKTIKNKNEKENVEKSITAFLPIYCLWIAFVTFIFPILFNFE